MSADETLAAMLAETERRKVIWLSCSVLLTMQLRQSGEKLLNAAYKELSE